jgi:hypothetical protein
MGLMFIEIFNPLQGGLQVGIAGALFYLAPLLWFWVGRSGLVTPEFLTFFSFRVVLPLGVVSMAWGLYQTYHGLLPFEQQWVEEGGYGALFIAEGVIRAIGFANSSAEYQRLLLLCAVFALCGWITMRSRLLLLLPVFLCALFLSAARGPVIMFALAACVLWAIRARAAGSWVPRFLAVAFLSAAALIALLMFLQTQTFGARIAPLVSRQVEGLLDPANEEKSTATGHLLLIEYSMLQGVTNPAGRGLGASTRAADKYGARTMNAEFDLPNVMLSLGVLGGLLYSGIVLVALHRAFMWWRAARQAAALVCVGALVATLGSWLIGGEYSMAALIWFYIGALDRLSVRPKTQNGRQPRALGSDHP